LRETYYIVKAITRRKDTTMEHTVYVDGKNYTVTEKQIWQALQKQVREHGVQSLSVDSMEWIDRQFRTLNRMLGKRGYCLSDLAR